MQERMKKLFQKVVEQNKLYLNPDTTEEKKGEIREQQIEQREEIGGKEVFVRVEIIRKLLRAGEVYRKILLENYFEQASTDPVFAENGVYIFPPSRLNEEEEEKNDNFVEKTFASVMEAENWVEYQISFIQNFVSSFLNKKKENTEADEVRKSFFIA